MRTRPPLRWLLLATLVATAVCGVVVEPTPDSAAPPTTAYASARMSASGTLQLEIQKEGVPPPTDRDDPSVVAWGRYVEAVNTTGWGTLHINSSALFPDQVQGEAIGLVEGALTQARIHDAYLNFIAFFFKNAPQQPAAVTEWTAKQLAWVRTQVAAHTKPGGAGSAFWNHVGVSVAQVEGLARGYNLTAPAGQALWFEDVYMLTNAGDLEDLLAAFPAEREGRAEGGHRPWAKTMSCSGLVVQGATEVYVGHTTFNMYAFMLRIFKHYSTAVAGGLQTTSFSARPGDLESKDDFYQLSSGLAVIETSLSVFNKSLYQALNTDTLPAWVRVSVANRMATTGAEWADIFSQHNSGTHNNQWIVVDYKKTKNTTFRGKGAVEEGLVWMLEQMPGYIHKEDITGSLWHTQGYVGSYNVPFFDDIFVMSGYKAAGFSYQNDVRAQIYRRDAPKVASIADMQNLMTQNSYKTDPLAKGDPCNAISSRCDLLSSGSYAFGGIDAKITSGPHRAPLAISGPTRNNGNPAFDFTLWPAVPQAGMPAVWDFDWGDMRSGWEVDHGDLL